LLKENVGLKHATKAQRAICRHGSAHTKPQGFQGVFFIYTDPLSISQECEHRELKSKCVGIFEMKYNTEY